jgi:hypothetical protein
MKKSVIKILCTSTAWTMLFSCLVWVMLIKDVLIEVFAGSTAPAVDQIFTTLFFGVLTGAACAVPGKLAALTFSTLFNREFTV